MKKLMLAVFAAVLVATFTVTDEAEACSCYVYDLTGTCVNGVRTLDWDLGFCSPPMTFKIERKQGSGWVTVATGFDYADLPYQEKGPTLDPVLKYRVSCESCNPCAPVETDVITCN